MFGMRARGQVIPATIGAAVAIPLKANLSIPYRWHPILPASVTLAGDSRYVSDPAPPGWTGQGGTETFTVIAHTRGRHPLRFEWRDIRDGKVGEVVRFLLVARRGEGGRSIVRPRRVPLRPRASPKPGSSPARPRRPTRSACRPRRWRCTPASSASAR